MPNKLSQFWQELKRRNVVRVITVYAGAAFVILELVDIVSPSLRLPEWTMNFMIVLLCSGFIIAVILSWIYDIHPEGGIVKTEPAHKVKTQDIPKSSNSWKIASYISFVVIVGLIILNIIPRTKKSEGTLELERSIAVLPFENMSVNEEDYYIGGAFTDEIIMELQKISAFDRVLSRTSTLQFEESTLTIPEIAEKLSVNYVIEGSIQRLEGRVRIRVQVIRAHNEDHIWGESYDEAYTKPEDILDIQSRIAHAVADELKVRITPEERELIDRVPTSNMEAQNLFQRGKEEYTRFLVDVMYNKDALQRAKEYFSKALEHDSTFANAYAGLAMTAYSGLVSLGLTDYRLSEGYLERNVFDSVYYLANKALLYDDQLDEAYLARAKYYFQTGQRDAAEQDFNRAITLNPNQWEAYFGIGELYIILDVVKAMEYYRKASTLTRGSEYLFVLMRISVTYMYAGLNEEGVRSFREYLNLESDSLIYYFITAWTAYADGNLINATEFFSKAYAIDSTNPLLLFTAGEYQADAGNYEDGFNNMRTGVDLSEKLGIILYNNMHRLGYYLYLAGYREEAEYYFDRQEEICKIMIELDRPYAQQDIAQYDLALTYAFRGKKERAMELLRMINNKSSVSMIFSILLPTDQMLDGIRDDPEFQQIEKELNLKFQAERVRIRQWLEEHDML